MLKLYRRLSVNVRRWLTYEPPPTEIVPYDFNRLKYEIRPGDVLLIEGRSRVSSIIRTLTQSPWTHAALYIGRLIDFEDEAMIAKIHDHVVHAQLKIDPKSRLMVEDMMDKGAIISPITIYRNHHIRICRPIGITPTDLHMVLNYAIRSLGQPYNVRHLLDLARFLLPWSILPRRWGSSLFRTRTGEPESSICSSLIAEAFSSVQFPILPFVKQNEELEVEMFNRNPHLFTPKDFDYSPYFEIIKYPLFNSEEPLPYYRRMPWTKSGFMHQGRGVLAPPKEKKEKKSRFFGRYRKDSTENPPDTPSDTDTDKK